MVSSSVRSRAGVWVVTGTRRSVTAPPFQRSTRLAWPAGRSSLMVTSVSRVFSSSLRSRSVVVGAPWRIRLTDQVRALFVDEAPQGWLAMLEATLAHGLSRKAIMERIARGDLRAVHLRTGRRKGLRIEPPTPQQALFQP